jgi:hypothetical protein
MIKNQKEKELNLFMEKVNTMQERSYKSKNAISEEALRDASQTAFKIICVPPERIAEFFAISNYSLLISQGIIHVVPPKQQHSWTYPCNMRIPLSSGVRTPRLNDGKPMFFTISKFIFDQEFLQRCRNYYQIYGIDITFEKDAQKNKWKIILKPSNTKHFFPQE